MLDRKEVRFGMREIRRKGLKFTVNGRPTFMRATLEDFIFPLTGYPPMDVESWRKVILVAKSYGLGYGAVLVGARGMPLVSMCWTNDALSSES